tara:strand:- start:1744 stop:3075 length:1332 start_codon:yes stop_codon:yes gene_type:complete
MLKISLLIPTRIRPKMMETVWNSALQTAYYPNNLEVCFYIDNDDKLSINKIREMTKINKQIKFIIGDRILLSETWNKLQQIATGTIYWHGNDDCIFRSKYWDKYIIDIFNKSYDKLILVYGKDGIWNGRKISYKYTFQLATAGFIHKNWIAVSGYYLPPYFSSDYNDTWLSEVFYRANRLIYIPNIYIEHMHYSVGKMVKDQNTLDRENRGKKDEVDKLYISLQNKRDDDLNKLLNIINTIHKKRYKNCIIVMDCWDKHWDENTNIISKTLNIKINNYLIKNRKDNLIIHCPNDCENYYKNYKNYINNLSNIKNLYIKKQTEYNKLPYIWKDPPNSYKAWTKQSDIIKIHENDIICFNPNVIVNILKYYNINTINYVGYHLNCCILYTRPMSALHLYNNNFKINIIYELCDTLYDDRYKSNLIKNKNDAINEIIKSINKLIKQ